MKKASRIAQLLVVATALCLATSAFAQAGATAKKEVVHKSGTVLAKYDGKVLIKMDDGTNKEFTPKAGATVMVDGKPTTFADLKVGTVLQADFVKTTTTVPVQTTQIKEAKVVKVAGQTIIVQDKKGFKAYTVPTDFRFLIDGQEKGLQDVFEGMNLTATIVSKSTKTVTESEIKNIAGAAPAPPPPPPAAPAAAPAPPPAAPVVAPAPPPPPAPAPAPAKKKLPKTGSPLPLAALGGALSLLAGLSLRASRKSR